MTDSKGPQTGCPAAGAAAGYPERGVRLGGGTSGSASGGGSPGRAPLRHKAAKPKNCDVSILRQMTRRRGLTAFLKII
jgi:hypothetical protein